MNQQYSVGIQIPGISWLVIHLCYSTVTCKVLLNPPQYKMGQHDKIVSLRWPGTPLEVRILCTKCLVLNSKIICLVKEYLIHQYACYDRNKSLQFSVYALRANHGLFYAISFSVRTLITHVLKVYLISVFQPGCSNPVWDSSQTIIFLFQRKNPP